jgi:enoyl-CoA hydratase/carnithine racemase
MLASMKTDPSRASIKELRVHYDSGVCTVTLARASNKNAFTSAMYERLAQVLESLDSEECRCLLIQAEGDSFCAGNDLNDFLTLDTFDDNTPVVRVLRALATLECPVVAAVDGAAVGIGTTLLLHCDLVYATPEARFAAPFVPLGLVPEAASSRLLPELVGHRRAMAMFLLGEFLTAESALAAGLVSHIVAQDALAQSASEAATRVAALPAAAARATRRLCRMAPASVSATVDRELPEFAECLQTAEARTAITAVLKSISNRKASHS